MEKVLSAFMEARDSGSMSRLIVDTADNGGVVSIVVESKKKYK